MRGLKITGAVFAVLVIAVVGGYLSAVASMPLGQSRLLRIGHTRVLMETVPPTESGFWSQPIYAEMMQNRVLKRVATGHSVRVGRLNFYAVQN